MRSAFHPRLFALLGLFALSGCSSVGDMADSMGSYMPVIGERCEHWQCFTQGGRDQSEMNKRVRAVREGGVPPEAPAGTAQPAQTTADGRKPIPQNPGVQTAAPASGATGMKPAAPPTPAGDPMTNPYDYYHGSADLPPPAGAAEEE